MGQTLTHGVYLPDEGERNCYNGLAANWQLLDNSVGTIAEHTTALAGKAPAVHTHTKSDVTDLLNSNFIPSANNSYDLGSSSYQWNNVYAKGYYYNGVAWGLDKYNQWTEVNDFNNLIGLNGAELWFKNQYIDDFTTNPAEYGGQSVLQIWNKNTTQYSGGLIDYQMTDGSHILEITCFGYPLNDATPYQHRFRFAAYRDGVADFYPTLNSVNLGTSINKWKSLNGVNPGALSLPSGGTTENTDWFNVVGDILPTGGNATNFSWEQNFFTPSKDGWLALTIKQCSAISVWCDTLKYGMSVAAPDALLNRQLLVPVVANMVYEIRITGNSWFSARLIMPKGNV